MTDYRERERRFLEVWKQGVALAGQDCFKVSAPSVEDATDKRQLEPDWDFIEETLMVRSRGEAAFLAAMCSFYNPEWGQSLLVRAGYPNLCDLAAKLDAPRAKVIAALFVSYPGW